MFGEIKADERIIVMPKMRSNRIIANGYGYEVSKEKVQYQLPRLEKYKVGDFVGDEMIIGIVDGRVKLKNIVNPLTEGRWVEMYNL